MFSAFRSQPQYVVLAQGEYRDEDKTGEPLQTAGWSRASHRRMDPWTWAVGFCVLLGIGITATIAAVKSIQGAANVCTSNTIPTPTHVVCAHPAIRREWRTLSRGDRREYIAAVQCLSTQPSKVHTNGSLYDDFPRVHQETANTAHKAAPFLPWHRYFLHAYETALKEQCGYSGVVPYVYLHLNLGLPLLAHVIFRYWDWSQDWQDMPHAPVWDAEGGFGGDGASDAPITVGNGRCVRNGPFANLEARYFGDQAHSHCLSRGFATRDELRRVGAPISPEALEDLSRSSSSFEDFAQEIEHRAHAFMRDGIRGDFSAYTGPYGMSSGSL